MFFPPLYVSRTQSLFLKGISLFQPPDCFCVKTLNEIFGKPGQDKDNSRVTGLREELGGSSATDSGPTLHAQMRLRGRPTKMLGLVIKYPMMTEEGTEGAP